MINILLEIKPEGGLMLGRQHMIEQQLKRRNITDPEVLHAFSQVPRENFVPTHLKDLSYADQPLAIGYDATISQPYIVALTLQAAALKKGERVLEVGTGSGYQTALIHSMGCEVYTIEIVPQLMARAKQCLKRLGIDDIHYWVGDAHLGWPEDIQFDAILMSAAPIEIPAPLMQQLKVGGRLIGPAGEEYDQWLYRITRNQVGFTKEQLTSVRFVPLQKKICEDRSL